VRAEEGIAAETADLVVDAPSAWHFSYPFRCMTRSRFTRAVSRFAPVLVLCAVAASAPLPALAQRTPQPSSPPKDDAPASTVSLADRAKAEEHFKSAKELYSAGKYSEAITELEAARALDPKARDLVMNLGIVNEKLGKFDDAIAWFKTYLEMEGVTPQERAKAEGSIKRIEGAKREAPVPAVTATTTSTAAGARTPPPPPPDKPERGRIDAATIAAGSVAIVAIGVGSYFGIHSLATRPDNFVTARDGSYAALQERQKDAHTSAIIADVGIGVGIVALLATAYLYFGRTKDPKAVVAPSTGATPWKASGLIMVALP